MSSSSCSPYLFEFKFRLVKSVYMVVSICLFSIFLRKINRNGSTNRSESLIVHVSSPSSHLISCTSLSVHHSSYFSIQSSYSLLLSSIVVSSLSYLQFNICVKKKCHRHLLYILEQSMISTEVVPPRLLLSRSQDARGCESHENR